MYNSVQVLPNFIEFNEYSRPDKPLSVREIFCNMLVCVKGLSPGMAWAITEKYPTPRLLSVAYQCLNCDNSSDTKKAIENFLAGIPYDQPVPKKLPPSVAKIVGHLFNDKLLN